LGAVRLKKPRSTSSEAFLFAPLAIGYSEKIMRCLGTACHLIPPPSRCVPQGDAQAARAALQ
jgi:hypothetical protein